MDFVRRVKSSGIRLGITLAGFLLPTLVAAQNPPQFDPGGTIKQGTGLGTLGLDVVVIEIIQFVLALLGLIAIAFIIYAGLLYLMSAGNADTLKKAKGVLQAAIIGLLIILAAYGISSYVFSVAVNVTSKQ